MSNFELISKILDLGVDFKITVEDPHWNETYVMYVSSSHMLYPDEYQQFFWHVNDWGHDSIWYCNDVFITIELVGYITESLTPEETMLSLSSEDAYQPESDDDLPF